MEKAIIENGIVQGYKCVACGDTFYSVPWWGYCDNTLDCTDLETIQPFTWVADEFDLKHSA